MGALDPDPIRDLFTSGARTLLDRAYARPGRWQSTRLVYPSGQMARRVAMLGVDPYGPDNSSARGGKTRARPAVNARDRWTRGFIRCLYHQHKWHAADPEHRTPGWRERRSTPAPNWDLEIDVGRRLPGSGTPGAGLPAGRSIRIRIREPLSGRELAALSPAVRTVDTDRPGGRWSDPTRRDWAGDDPDAPR